MEKIMVTTITKDASKSEKEPRDLTAIDTALDVLEGITLNPNNLEQSATVSPTISQQLLTALLQHLSLAFLSIFYPEPTR
jgi:hypothetical protein